MTYYSFFKDTDSDGSVVYLFSTKDNTIYTIVFDATLYLNYLNDFPQLLQNSFGIGIYADPKPLIKDPRVSKTIIEIIFDFFSTENKESIVLYHCDYIDGKQHIRNRIFEFWHNKGNTENRIFRYNLEVYIPEVNTNHYIGFVCLTDNHSKDDFINEFATFSVELISYDSPK